MCSSPYLKPHKPIYSSNASALISWMALYRANISSVVTQILLWSNNPIGSPARRRTATGETSSSPSRLASVPEIRKRFLMVLDRQMPIHRGALGTSRQCQRYSNVCSLLYCLALHTFSLLVIVSTFTGKTRQSARQRRQQGSSAWRKGSPTQGRILATGHRGNTTHSARRIETARLSSQG